LLSIFAKCLVELTAEPTRSARLKGGGKGYAIQDNPGGMTDGRGMHLVQAYDEISQHWRDLHSQACRKKLKS